MQIERVLLMNLERELLASCVLQPLVACLQSHFVNGILVQIIGHTLVGGTRQDDKGNGSFGDCCACNTRSGDRELAEEAATGTTRDAERGRCVLEAVDRNSFSHSSNAREEKKRGRRGYDELKILFQRCAFYLLAHEHHESPHDVCRLAVV